MATVLKLKFASGKIIRCDARCHNAKGDKCTCICDGTNRGVGFRQAILNSRTILPVDPNLTVVPHSLITLEQLDIFPELQTLTLLPKKGD